MLRKLCPLIGAVLVLPGAADARPDAVAQVKPKPVSATTFLVSGRGWGHGVGMSQYGALGMANEGRTHREILAHYYTGTELAPAPVARVRVLVAEAKATVTIASEAPFRVRDADGKTHALPAGDVKLGRTLEVVVGGEARELPGPLTFLPGKEPLRVDGRAYRGQVAVSVEKGKLNAVNALGLEQYLAGVVPDEMPPSWPEEALKAQAVAARSYALAHRVSGKDFDLYSDVRSQVYGGIEAEDERATRAIEATAGEVVTFEGRVADTLFHSTSGGRTVSAEAAFGTAVPYLVGVDDPWSSISPVHRWGPVAVTDVVARKGLRLGTPVTAIALVKGEAGRTGGAVVTTTMGKRRITGGELRFGLGLRSTWITGFRTARLTRPGGPALYGSTITVRADARGSKDVTLLKRVGRRWETARERPQGGRFSVKAELKEATSFRLLIGKLRGSVLRIPVAPRVEAVRRANGISGTVTPAREGATVQIQRLDGTRWRAAGETTMDAAGSFAAAELAPGTYRARVAPAGGLVQGLSGEITVG